LSSPSSREGEEGVIVAVDVVEVAAAEEDDNDKSVEVIPVLESLPRRSMYKKTTQIRIDPQGRQTGTLVLHISAREAGLDSPETGSVVWP
jgi:hypothetical protein